MSSEPELPLLTDMIESLSVVGSEDERGNAGLTDEHSDLSVEQEDLFDIAADAGTLHLNAEDEDSLEDYESVQELLIEEEVRMVLDKHMEAAYEEIIRLINHRQSHR